MSYQYLTGTGIIVPDTSDLKTQVETEWMNAFGDIDTSPHTPQGVMITAEILARENLLANNAQMGNQLNPNFAGGVFLDAICALMGIERRPAAASHVAGVMLTGIAGTAIPAGTQFKDVAGNIWQLRTGVMLGADGSATVNLYAAQPGPVGCAAGDLSEVYTPVLGLETVYNPRAATPGYEQESDIALMQRRRATLARQGISTPEAQVSALMDIEGVSSVAWLENISSVSQNIGGVDMLPHSIWACVDGGTDIEVATALWQNKTAGAGFNGANAQVITNQFSGQSIEVRYDRPQYVAVRVEVVGRMVGDKSVDPQQTIPAAVIDWVSGKMAGDPGLTIGTAASVFEVGGAINRYVPGFHVSNVRLWADGVLQPGNVEITLKQRAIIGPGDVSVIIV